MDVLVEARLDGGGVLGLGVGADLGGRVEVGAVRAEQPVRHAAVADQAGGVVDARSALDEAVGARRVGEQSRRVADALVIARVLRRRRRRRRVI